MNLEDSQCVFCAKLNDESELIEMATNSLVLDDEVIEFADLIRSLLFIKLQNESTTCICEQCKNILVQFYMFKENAKKNSFFREINCISQALNFVEENDEEVFCTRYNKCLTLVPHSRRKFSEVFQQWQPQVIMEKIEDLPEKILSEPPIKKQKHEEKPEIYPVTFTVNEVLDVADRISIVQEETEESNEGMSEKEWVRSEIENSELIETDTGSEWLCKYCEPGPISFTNLQDFRNHLLSTHLSYEQFSMIEVSPDDEEIIEEDYEVDNVEQSDYDDKSVISLKETKMKETEPKSRTRPSFSKIIKSPRFEKLVCIDCDYQFTSQAHFQAHLNGHHLYEIVSKYSNFPICSICNTMFCDENFESLHQQRHDNSELVNEPMPAEGCFLKLGHRRSQNVTETSNEFEIMGIISCGHCLKKFNDEESCRLHQLIFHVTVLKCPIENRLFKGNQAFTIHLKNNHPELFGDEVKFLCSVCKAEFETLFDKLRHMKICDMKKYACNHCDKKFSHKCYLTSHMRQVSGQSSVVCEICEKVCRDKGDYEIHKRSHSNIKPFKCSLCPKAYKTSSARAAHLETHNEDGFDCSLCTVKFKSRRTLHKHLKTKHPNKTLS